MAVAPRADPRDYFDAEQWAALSARSAWRGVWLIAHCWLTIAATMLVGWRWPWTMPLAIMVIGTRQLGLFVLMHDAAHALLHRDRRVNDWLGHWLCSPSLGA